MNIKTEDVKYTKIEYDTGNPIYKGYHKNCKASTAMSDWWIIKYTYDGSDITDIQETEGSWDNRASLF
jgi:hypothetical protein